MSQVYSVECWVPKYVQENANLWMGYSVGRFIQLELVFDDGCATKISVLMMLVADHSHTCGLGQFKKKKVVYILSSKFAYTCHLLSVSRENLYSLTI